jgi:hypothetical protein
MLSAKQQTTQTLIANIKLYAMDIEITTEDRIRMIELLNELELRITVPTTKRNTGVTEAYVRDEALRAGYFMSHFPGI